MKIAVYGATGMVGAEIVAEAVQRKHEVTAVSRGGQPIEGASSLAADITDTQALVATARDHDAVVLSVPPSRTGESHDGFIAAHEAIASSGVPARLFVVGGAGALEVDGAPLHTAPGFPDSVKPEATTMGAVLDIYRASSLDWTMLAPPPVIAPGERTAQYVVGGDSPVGESITTQDFAVATLDELENPQHRRVRFTVANPAER